MKKRHLLKKLFVLIAILYIVVAIVSGCTNLFDKNSVEQAAEDQTLQNPENQVPAGVSLIKMDLSSLFTRANEEYYIVYGDLSDRNVKHISVTGTEVSLELEKGKVYAIGLFKKYENQLSLVGVIGDSQTGLVTIPLSTDAASVIDLGKLFLDSDVLNPSLSFEEFSKLLGYSYETLKEFSNIDITAKNILNPDINRNGTFDDEEGVYWFESTAYDFKVENPQEFDNPQTPESYQDSCAIIVWINYKNHTLDYAPAVVSNVATLVIPSPDSNGTLEISPHHSESLEGNTYVYYFNPSYVGKGVFFFKSGTYKLIIHDLDDNKDEEFYFDWAFLNPYETNGGFLFPFYRLHATADGILESMEAKWLLYKNGEKESLDKEAISVAKGKITIVPWEVVRDGNTEEKDIRDFQPLNASEYYIELDDLYQLNTFGFKVIRVDHSDIAGNTYVLRQAVVHSPKPYKVDTVTDWQIPTSEASLLGIWYNHAFIWDEAYPTVIILEPEGSALVYDNWDNLMEHPTEESYEKVWNFENGVLSFENTYSCTPYIGHTEDGRKILKLSCDSTTVYYIDFYSYIESYGASLQSPSNILKGVTITKIENGQLFWEITWDNPYNGGIVHFNVYVGDDAKNLHLKYFLFSDQPKMEEGKFSLDLSQLGLDEETAVGKYFKIIATDWSGVVESEVFQYQ